MEHEIKLGKDQFYIGESEEKAIAKITWTWRDEKTLVADHTFTAPELRGQGVAGKLMKALVDYAREKGYGIVADCTYVQKVMDKDPEKYSDLRVM